MKDYKSLDRQRFFSEQGDPGFSPENNRAIIESIIEKHEKKRKEKMKEFEEGLGERTEAATAYLIHLSNGKSTPIEKYFGRQELLHLKAQRVFEKVQGNKKQLLYV